MVAGNESLNSLFSENVPKNHEHLLALRSGVLTTVLCWNENQGRESFETRSYTQRPNASHFATSSTRTVSEPPTQNYMEQCIIMCIPDMKEHFAEKTIEDFLLRLT